MINPKEHGQYILMHKKIAVAHIDIDDETGVISKVGEVYSPHHIPVGIQMAQNRPNRGDLNDWWQGRAIPASRQNIRQALKTLGVSSSGRLLVKCYGLSLSDQYWVNPGPLKWEDINFFNNPFTKDVGDIFFGDVIHKKPLDLLSPDNTSDGWLKKKWQIINGKRCLIKGGSDPYWQQPLNEVMVTNILKRLGIAHVPYSLVWRDGLPYSVCENFITPNTELVSAYYIHNTKKIADADNLYNHYLECSAYLGIPDAQTAVDKMLVADFLVANTDRHMNNFGAVRNAETLEWIAPAPLYDNGTSLWHNQSADRINGNVKSQPFRDTHEEQIKHVKDFTWLDKNAIKGIDDEFNDLLKLSPLIDTTRRDALCFALKKRVGMLNTM